LDSEDETESSDYDSEEEAEEESEETLNSQSEYDGYNTVANPIMEVASPVSDDIRSRSALGMSPSVDKVITADTANVLAASIARSKNGILNSTLSPSKRSSRSKNSLLTQ